MRSLLGSLALSLVICIVSCTINKDVVRIIDGSSAIVKTSIEIKAESVDNNLYELYFPNTHAAALAFISVTVNGVETEIGSPVQNINYTVYSIPVKDSNPSIKVQATFTGILEPFPTEILQSDNQLVKYSDNHYFISPYKTDNQRTAYTLASTSIETYTKRTPSSVRGSSVVFGPYKDIPPFEISPLVVHSVNNKPFAKFSTMTKEIEVSHWGIISFEEIYELKHAGAKLKGGFSRFDYQSRRFADSPSFRSLKAILPAEATNIYYRDQIGNISTSDLKFRSDAVEMEIQSRFPIFGGWQTQFYLGYSVPTETALFVDADTNRHKLKVDFFSVFQDVWVEESEIKVVLPEGCSDIQVKVPYPTEQSWTRRYTYLDTVLNGGRPVLILKAKNLVPQHNKQVEITYSFSRTRMLVEPLLLIASIFVFFLFCSILARMDEKATAVVNRPTINASNNVAVKKE